MVHSDSFVARPSTTRFLVVFFLNLHAHRIHVLFGGEYKFFIFDCRIFNLNYNFFLSTICNLIKFSMHVPFRNKFISSINPSLLQTFTSLDNLRSDFEEI